MLVSETVSVLVIDAQRKDSSVLDRLDQIPLMKGFKEKIQDPCDGVDARLKEKGLYFYKDDGSVFMDYKILRRIARIKVGESLGETDKEKAESRGYGIFCDRFNLETSIEKLLAQAREFVGTWAWSE